MLRMCFNPSRQTSHLVQSQMPLATFTPIMQQDPTDLLQRATPPSSAVSPQAPKSVLKDIALL